MLGQPVSMLIPKVVGFKLVGELPEGATATDLVLTITEMLREHGVVGKFVEFYGEGVAAVPLANRATIGNMSPEYGSTVAIFPIDDETIRYLRMTGREEQQVALVEAYAKEQGLWHDPAGRARLQRDDRARPRRPSSRRSPARSGRRTGSRCPTRRPASATRWPTTPSTQAAALEASTRRPRSPSRPATRRPTTAPTAAARRAAHPTTATVRPPVEPGDGQRWTARSSRSTTVTSSSRRSPRAPTPPTRR